MHPNPLTNLCPVEVTLDDGSKASFMLRQLSIRQLYQFMRSASEQATPDIVELCFGQPKGWADTLSPEVFGQLAEKAIALNFPRAAALVGRDPVAAGLLAPLIQQMVRLTQSMPGPVSSPASASSPAGDGSAPSMSLPAVSPPSSQSTAA